MYKESQVPREDRMSGAASEAISPYGINQLKIASSLRSSITASCLIYLLHGPGQPLDRFAVSPSPCSRRNDDLTRGPLTNSKATD
jgi:hypothetical protein